MMKHNAKDIVGRGDERRERRSRPRRDARPASPDDGGAPSHSLCRSAAPLRRLTVYGGMLNSASKHLRDHLHLDGEEQRTRPREAHARGGGEQ
jgi:hypothetical protein